MLRGVLADTAGWGVLGFLLGAGFCVAIAVREGSDQPTQHTTPQPQAEIAAGCTTLALDRHGGRTIAEPCPGLAPQLAVNLNGHPDARSSSY
jgi:hypothetical protein